MRFLLLITLLAANTLPGYEVTFKTDSLHGSLGDIITFSWEIRHQKELEVTLGDLDIEGSGIEILNQALNSTEQGSELQFSTAIYDSVGIYEFPSFPVYLQGQNRLDSLILTGPEIEIRSILMPADTNFHDIKGLHKIRMQLNPWAVLVVLTLLVLLYVVYLLYKRYRRIQSAEDAIIIIPPEEAHLTALRELERLRNSNYLKREDFKRFYSELSRIIKQYYENRYLIDALEQTTSELIMLMESMNEFDPQLVAETNKILNTADFIKFAKGTSSPAESNQMLEKVVEIVNSTRLQTVPEDAAAIDKV